VAEGAGAAPVAALLAGKIPGPAVAVISGRNIAPQTLARLLAG
jgi:threonine dehydratase